MDTSNPIDRLRDEENQAKKMLEELIHHVTVIRPNVGQSIYRTILDLLSRERPNPAIIKSMTNGLELFFSRIEVIAACERHDQLITLRSKGSAVVGLTEGVLSIPSSPNLDIVHFAEEHLNLWAVIPAEGVEVRYEGDWSDDLIIAVPTLYVPGTDKEFAPGSLSLECTVLDALGHTLVFYEDKIGK